MSDKMGPLQMTALTLSAALCYAAGALMRSSGGVMLGLISSTTGLAYSEVSSSIALAELTFGIMQPVMGAIALKRSAGFVMRLGLALLASGFAALPLCSSIAPLIAVYGLILPAGAASLSYGTIMSVLTRRLPKSAVSAASGFVSASSGLAAAVAAPSVQAASSAHGIVGASAVLAAPQIALLPITVWLCRGTAGDASARRPTMRELFSEAMARSGYRRISAAFFTCGFHMAIIQTHLFSQMTSFGILRESAAYIFSIYGISALVGSMISGWLCGRVAPQRVLGSIYAARVAIVAAYIAAPKTVPMLAACGIALGLTAGSTVPPTSGITSSLFGPAKLPTLFGMAFLFHQIGGAASSLLGGALRDAGSEFWQIWTIDAVLCAAAAIMSFGVKTREP